MSLYKSWLTRKISARILIVLIIIFGALSTYNLPLDISPSVEFPRLTISVYASNSSPETVERQISSPIEERVQSIPNITNIKSSSKENYARITLELNKNTDIQYTTFLISEVLADYKDWLPEEAGKPRIIKYVPKEFRKKQFMSYRILSDLPESSLNRIWQEKIKPALLNMNGIAQTELFGIRKQVLKILLDTEIMSQYHITLSQIKNALLKKRSSVGFLRKKIYKNSVIIDNRFDNIEELKNTPIKKNGVNVLKIKDVAHVLLDYEDLRSIKRINGKNTYLLSLDKELGANTINVADKVYKKIGQLENEFGDDISFIVENDSSVEIRQSISDITTRAAISLLIMFLLLWFAYRRISASFVIIFNILLAVSTVMTLIYLFNYSLNLITIGGIALGLGFVIDNAILTYDAVISDVSLVQLKHLTAPIIASTLTTLTALFPFLFLTGDLRIYYIPFAFVITVTLIASVMMALLFIPHMVSSSKITTALSKKSLKSDSPPKKSENIIPRFRLISKNIIAVILKRPVTISLLALWLFGIPLWLLPQSLPEKKGDNVPAQIVNDYILPAYENSIGSSIAQEYIFPILGGATYLFVQYVDKGEVLRWYDRTYLSVYLRLPHGSDINIVKKNILLFEKETLKSNDIKKVETTIYGESANIRIDFTKKGLTSGTQYHLKNKLTRMAVDVGGARISVYGFGPGFSSGYSGSTSSYRVLLYGYNYLDLKNLALKFKNRIEKNPRIRNVDINASGYFNSEKTSHLVMHLDRGELAREGLTLSEILAVIRLNNYESLSRNRIQLGGKEVLYEIKTGDYKRSQIDDLYAKSHYSALGKLFRFKHFSKIKSEELLNEIRRENQQYERVVAYDYLGPYEFGNEFLDDVISEFYLPPGYFLKKRTYRFGDDVDYTRLYLIVLTGLLLIYMVTAALYESFKYPFLIFLTIPSGLIGIFLIFYFMDISFNSSAYLGVLFISGIVVNNAIILISRFQENLKNNKPLKQAISDGIIQHMRPIFLTTITTIIGFVPLVLLSSQSAGGIWYSLAVAGIGGILSSFCFIIIVLPALYFLFERKSFEQA